MQLVSQQLGHSGFISAGLVSSLLTQCSCYLLTGFFWLDQGHHQRHCHPLFIVLTGTVLHCLVEHLFNVHLPPSTGSFNQDNKHRHTVLSRSLLLNTVCLVPSTVPDTEPLIVTN